MDLAEEQPQPSAQTSHFATTQQAILAPQVSDITDQPFQDPAVVEISNMHEDVSMQDPPSTTHIPIMHNFSQELLTPWGCLGVKIFVDICSGADKPLSAALQNLGYPALAVDILLDSRMDLLNDEFLEQILRLCGSGIVGYTGAVHVPNIAFSS